MTFRLGLAALAFIFVAGACTCSPLPIDDHKYACITDSDCGPELSCVNGVCGGTTPPDAGKDGGFDAGQDAGTDAGFDVAPARARSSISQGRSSRRRPAV